MVEAGQGDSVVIIASRPQDTPIPATVRFIDIEPGGAEGKPEKLRQDEIDDVIRRIPPESVIALQASRTVFQPLRLTRLPPIDRFKNLTRVAIEAAGIKDLSPLFALEHLKVLQITACQPDNLSALRGRPLDYVRLISGNVAHFDLTTNHALFQSCRHLVSFAGAEISYLELETCMQVDLSTLASVCGLTALRMVASGPVVKSFDFLVGCRSLKVLTVTTPLSKADFSALGRAPVLRCAFLGVRRSVLKRLAAESPHLLLTNGDICFRGEQEMKHIDYERECDAVLGIGKK